MRAFLLGLMFLVCACTSGPFTGSPGSSSAATAKSVVLQDRDIPDIQKCPYSDRWADLMLNGEPEMLPTGFATWSDLQAAGATEGWLSIYADDPSECPLLFGLAPPKGRLVYSAVIKFKDSASAAASFTSGSDSFPVAGYFAARFAAAGGTMNKGADTGIGKNSAVATISVRGVPTYVAFWQNKTFNAVLWADNMSTSEASTVAIRMNARIH